MGFVFAQAHFFCNSWCVFYGMSTNPVWNDSLLLPAGRRSNFFSETRPQKRIVAALNEYFDNLPAKARQVGVVAG